jgi:hypothetical protein
MISDAGSIPRAAIVIVTSWWRRSATQRAFGEPPVRNGSRAPSIVISISLTGAS